MKSNLSTFVGLVAAVAVCAGASPLQAEAGVSASLSSSPPTTDIALSNVATVSGGYGWIWTTADNRRDLGQIFKVETAFTLDKIVLPVSSAAAGAPNAAFSISLYEFTTIHNTAGSYIQPTSAALYTATGNLPGSGLEADVYLTFDVPDMVLKRGKTYGFVLSFSHPESGQTLNFSIKYGGSYNPGNIIISSDGLNFKTLHDNQWDNDLNFYLLSPSSKIPEPSTYALFAGVLPLAIWVAWTRSRRRGPIVRCPAGRHGASASPEHGINASLRQRVRSSRHGFTLVELLAVIAIIGILAGILIPVVGRVRESGRSVQCLANLRSSFLILMNDVQENKNTLPLAWSDETKTGWMGTIYYSLKVVQKDLGGASALSCPSQLDRIGKTGSDTSTFSMNLVPTRALLNPQHPNRPHMSNFVAPARTAILADGCPTDTSYNLGFAFNAGRLPEFIHRGRVNILFLDGHVSSLSEAEIPASGGTNASVVAGTPEGLFWIGR